MRSPQTLPHWRGEISEFRRALRKRFTATIRNRLVEELQDLHEDVLKGMIVRELITTVQAANAERYTWDQIVDPDFYPESRYA